MEHISGVISRNMTDILDRAEGVMDKKEWDILCDDCHKRYHEDKKQVEFRPISPERILTQQYKI